LRFLPFPCVRDSFQGRFIVRVLVWVIVNVRHRAKDSIQVRFIVRIWFRVILSIRPSMVGLGLGLGLALLLGLCLQ
jgi:hypothetical protein